MAKRSSEARRRRDRTHGQYEQAHDGDNVRRLFDQPQWSPLGAAPSGAEREQKYRKNIRAHNPAQQALIDAIDQNPLVFAAGSTRSARATSRAPGSSRT